MPGRCPSCNQTYTDETLSFCPNDGTPLVKDAPSSYDPQATMIAPPPPNYAPQQDYPPQQGYYAPQGGQTPPPQGGQTPPPGWQQPPPQYGQQPPPSYGQQQQQYTPPQYGAAAVGSKSKLPLIIALAAVLLIGGGIAAYFLMRDNSTKVSSNTNTYSTSTSNANRTANATTNTTMQTMPGTTTTSTPSTTSSTTTTTGSSNYSDDEKHKLFQAVGITRDNALIVDVAEKIGISDSTGNPNSSFQPFIKEHFNWAVKNAAWVQEYRDPQKAREYVMEHK